MDYDLKIIKDNYGEKMMHLCRSIFPTLLEEKGALSTIMLKTFAPTKFLYEDIIKEYYNYETDKYEANSIDWFKDYIYSLLEEEKKEFPTTTKTPEELLDEVGYQLYECKTEKEIQYFAKYYHEQEKLCTFDGGRLKYCHVFFAVKKNVDEIKREITPKREDKYGTSVISIQFSKGNVNTLSIKNRYNHTVKNPDATFSNNLENIASGLTRSFEQKYQLKIMQNNGIDFRFNNYVKANDGRYYRYNHEINNIYYCQDNIIIDNFEVKQLEKEKYIVMDYFILDLVNKKIVPYDSSINDSFIDGIWHIQNINIKKIKEGKEIIVTLKNGRQVSIEINKENCITKYKNENLTIVGDEFLSMVKSVQMLDLPKLKKVGNHFLEKNKNKDPITLPSLEKIGSHVNRQLDLPALKVAGIWTGYNVYNGYKKVKTPLSERLFGDHDTSMFIIGMKKANKKTTQIIREIIALTNKMKHQKERKNKKR